ncbi:oxidoreductase [Kitasatospora sp. MMS16-BH015]|uniref:CBS domain-containing protein n=1 Tax=Kitasatospora sp. MMS16-BH015 TaxID=2018025 RepID=UPI000CA24985|nr:CBS domain-containing protein [Kitasatospora sp. MMS16-BH015]AUG81697.1 oxidoreductase [Kitasatospora sp. MMS16-BH015]
MSSGIRELMTGNPLTVAARASVREAARRMRDADTGEVLVTEAGRLCGLLTERDLLIRALAEGRDPVTTTVGELCESTPLSVGPDEAPARALDLMRRHARPRLPVLAAGRLLGTVSRTDLTDLLATETDETDETAETNETAETAETDTPTDPIRRPAPAPAPA